MDFLFAVPILLEKNGEHTLPVSKIIPFKFYNYFTYVLVDATVAGGIAVPLTPSPFTVMEGESAMLSFLIALVDRSLNVSSSVEVDHDFDGELPSANITNRNNDRYDVLFPPIAYGINIFIDFNRRSILAEPFQLDLQCN